MARSQKSSCQALLGLHVAITAAILILHVSLVSSRYIDNDREGRGLLSATAAAQAPATAAEKPVATVAPRPSSTVKTASAPAAPAPKSASPPSASALLSFLSGLGKLVESIPVKQQNATSPSPSPVLKPSPVPAPPSPPPPPPPRSPSPTPSPSPASSPSAASSSAIPDNSTTSEPEPPTMTIMEEWIKNGTCKSTMLPNGDFELNKWEDYRIKEWIKIKEYGSQGGGVIGNGSDPGATGWPSYPFDNTNQYFRSQTFGNVGFALVNEFAFTVNNTKQILYFDWYMDNGFDYWLVPETMSIHANNSNVTLHAARVDLYDYDKLVPPGNITDLAQQLFDPFNATAGPAYLGTALTVDDIIQFPNLQSVGSYVPLAPYVGKKLMIAFRYSTTVYYLSWGFDNVSIVECDDSLGFPMHKRRFL